MAIEDAGDHGPRQEELEARLRRLEELVPKPAPVADPTPEAPWSGQRIGHLIVTGIYHTGGRVAGFTCLCEGPNCTRPGTEQNTVHVTIAALRKKCAPQGCPRCWKYSELNDPKEKARRKSNPTRQFEREYRIWARLRKEGQLCAKWRRSFVAFLRDLGPKDASPSTILCRRLPGRIHGPANSFWGPRFLSRDAQILNWRGTRFVAMDWFHRHGSKLGMTEAFFRYHVFEKADPVTDADLLMVLWEESKAKQG